MYLYAREVYHLLAFATISYLARLSLQPAQCSGDGAAYGAAGATGAGDQGGGGQEAQDGEAGAGGQRGGKKSQAAGPLKNF